MHVTFAKKPANENIQFNETKTLNSNSYLLRQRFEGYRCKSDIAIFALKTRFQSF